MLYRIAVVSVAALPLALASAASADTIYTLSPFPGAPTFTGQIVTDGTVGPLTAANIVSWTYTTAGQTFSGTGADVRLSGSNPLSATATELTVQGFANDFVPSFQMLHTSSGFYDDVLGWYVYGTSPGSTPYVLIDHRGRPLPPNTWFQVPQFNTASVTIATVVPAPASALLVGGLSLSLTRRRR